LCVIIYKPQDKSIPRWALESAYKRNNDGWGMMALDDNGIPFMRKAVGEQIPGHGFEEFMNAYELDFAHRECAIHFRYRTHGAVDLENAHPYPVGNNAYLMHNGTINNIRGQEEKGKSDSWHFARIISEQVEKGWLRTEGFRNLIEMALGYTNRVVLLDPAGFVIFNKHQGEEFFGCWFSNTYAWASPTKSFGCTYYGMDYDEDTFQGRHNRGSIVRGRYRESYGVSRSGQSLKIAYLPDGTKVVCETAATSAKAGVEKSQTNLEKEIESITTPPKPLDKMTESEREAWLAETDAKLAKIGAPSYIAADNPNVLRPPQTVLDEEIVGEFIELPKTLEEWAALTEQDIKELASEEPEMVGEAFCQSLSLLGGAGIFEDTMEGDLTPYRDSLVGEPQITQEINNELERSLNA
jgi:hypothetical protein